MLESLQCSRYLSPLEAEEIDIDALAKLQEKELEVLGIPKGPRLKMLRGAHTEIANM